MENYTKEIEFAQISGTINSLAVMILNRPAALNALNLSMIRTLEYHLKQCVSNDAIQAVVIKAVEGRAFCAGGDIRAAYVAKQEKQANVTHFFKEEYGLNRLVYHFPKPYIALLDGITMGGGAGISIHGSYRIGSERLLFAMPETGIGFFPDIGASYFLPRLPHYFGFYLGLTGVRIGLADCLALGLVDFYIPHAEQEVFLQTLPDVEIATAIKMFAKPAEKSLLWHERDSVEKCFSKNTVEEIIAALLAQKNNWCQETAALLQTRSPTSLKVTLRALQKGRELDFDACMQMEYNIAMRFLAGEEFFEGIRAAVIDKDQKPHWQPAVLADVSDKAVSEYFGG